MATAHSCHLVVIRDSRITTTSATTPKKFVLLLVDQFWGISLKVGNLKLLQLRNKNRAQVFFVKPAVGASSEILRSPLPAASELLGNCGGRLHVFAARTVPAMLRDSDARVAAATTLR